MSGMWMMHRSGPDPEDNLTTTYVPGLDKLRRETAIMTAVASLSVVLIEVAIVGILWGRIRWWENVLIAALVLMVFFASASTGAFIGRLGAFKDLSQAQVRIKQVRLDEEPGGDVDSV